MSMEYLSYIILIINLLCINSNNSKQHFIRPVNEQYTIFRRTEADI